MKASLEVGTGLQTREHGRVEKGRIAAEPHALGAVRERSHDPTAQRKGW